MVHWDVRSYRTDGSISGMDDVVVSIQKYKTIMELFKNDNGNLSNVVSFGIYLSNIYLVENS